MSVSYKAVKIIKLIKSLISKNFEQLCKDMDSKYHQLLLYSEILWLS